MQRFAIRNYDNVLKNKIPIDKTFVRCYYNDRIVINRLIYKLLFCVGFFL